MYEKLNSALEELELGVPDPTLRLGSVDIPPVLRGTPDEARIIFKDVGPAGCLKGIGVGIALLVGAEGGLGLSGEWLVEEGFDGVRLVVERKPWEFARLGVGGVGAGVFRRASGLSSSEPESHASSSAQSVLD